MFVRKRANGNQLLEAYRDEEGKKRNRVVCSLGEHETPEAALEAAEAELEALLERPRRAARRVATYEERFKDDYAEGLAKWHGGEIPPLEEVLELARGIHAQAGYDPAWGAKWTRFWRAPNTRWISSSTTATRPSSYTNTYGTYATWRRCGPRRRQPGTPGPPRGGAWRSGSPR
jgi:hypothetical protein